MPTCKDPGDENSTPFRSAIDEGDRKCDEQAWENEGGHMSATAGRVMRAHRSKLPYVVTLTHHLSEATQHSFASMREAEAFIKRNTPLPGAVPAPGAPISDTESIMNDESILRG